MSVRPAYDRAETGSTVRALLTGVKACLGWLSIRLSTSTTVCYVHDMFSLPYLREISVALWEAQLLVCNAVELNVPKDEHFVTRRFHPVKAFVPSQHFQSEM